MSAPLFRIGAFGVLAVAVAGCGLADQGDGIAREAVSGTVALGGRPLDSASIVFLRADPGVPAVASGRVQNGRFSIPRADGPAVGPHKVRISHMAVGQPNPDTTPGAPSKISRETLPEKYNSATILITEIRAGQPNEFEFHLDAK